MNEDKDLQIENRLKELRKKSNLSQEELAEKLGISRQSVISLEQGKSVPSLPLAFSLCRFFDSAFEEMFRFHNEVEEEFRKMDNQINNISINSDPDFKLISQSDGKEKNMTELEPWRPFRETISLRDAMDRLFEDSFITPAKISGTMPKIDIKEKKDSVVIKAELPGVKEEDVDVEIMDNMMTISGEKKEEKEEKEEDKGYYYKETHTGSFTRTFSLPAEVVADKANAEMKEGILTITLPKIEEKKAKKVKIAKK